MSIPKIQIREIEMNYVEDIISLGFGWVGSGKKFDFIQPSLLFDIRYLKGWVMVGAAPIGHLFTSSFFFSGLPFSPWLTF